MSCLKISFILCCLLALLGAPAYAQNSAFMCARSSVTVCNAVIAIPFSSPVGRILTFTAPLPFAPEPFTVRCTNNGGYISYQITDSSAVTCSRQTCLETDLSVCGIPVHIPGGATVWQNLTIPIAASVLGGHAPPSNLSFVAQCAWEGSDQPVYKVLDTSQAPCNQFPCIDSTVNLCGTAVPVEGGASLGQVLHLTMPEPFAPDPFTVQCVGSAGGQPSYQVTNFSAVTCAQEP